MLTVNSKHVFLLLAGVLVVLSLLSGCRIEVAIGLYDDARFGLINNTPVNVTFYGKDDSLAGNVFDDENRLRDVLANTAQNGVRYRWFKGNARNRFAVEDTNSQLTFTQLATNLQDERHYWLVFWRVNNNFNLSILSRQALNQQAVYTVRVFANARLPISINNQPSTLFSEVGQATTHFEVEQCNDLQVGDIVIDLCQQGTAGESYLIVVDQAGSIVIAKE